jgi:hypothetical protein
MFDELIQAVSRSAGLSPEQAAIAVAAMLRFFTARLPSSLVGELHARLGTRANAPAGAPASASAEASPSSPESSQGNAGPPQVSLTPTGGGLGAARPWGRSE